MAPQNGFKPHGQSHPKFETELLVASQNDFKTYEQSHLKSKQEVSMVPQKW